MWSSGTKACLAVEQTVLPKADLQELQRSDFLVAVVVALRQQPLCQHAPARVKLNEVSCIARPMQSPQCDLPSEFTQAALQI